jgi:predicted nicotinamide N-methyase
LARLSHIDQEVEMSLRARVLTIAVLAGVVAVSSALAGCGVTLAKTTAPANTSTSLGRS